jgi:hypothetical protein
MAVLRSIAPAIVMILAGGCYSPQLRDCAVSCTAVADCAPGQVCGVDRLCASPDLAGRCLQLQEPDAWSEVAIDASTIGADAAIHHDAAPATDAQLFVALTVTIAGRGTVTVSAIGSCNDSAPQHTCTFPVPPGVQRTLDAIPADDQRFDKWTSTACANQGPTCIVTPTADMTVSAKFAH